jgi:hypothetical protein
MYIFHLFFHFFFSSSVGDTFTSRVDAKIKWMKRLFVYSAVTQFDTRNTSSDTSPFGGAGSEVFGLVSFACGGPGPTPSVCPYYFQGGRPQIIW